MAKPLLSTAGREHPPFLRRHVPNELIERLERGFSEADRINAIVSEIPGWTLEPRHRLDDAMEAQRDAFRASKEIGRYLSLRWRLWRWLTR